MIEWLSGAVYIMLGLVIYPAPRPLFMCRYIRVVPPQAFVVPIPVIAPASVTYTMSRRSATDKHEDGGAPTPGDDVPFHFFF